MRTNKFVGVGLLVVVLAVGSVVAGFAAAKDVTANFAIPDYISISAASSVNLPTIDGPGTYSVTNALTVVSTSNWGVSHSFEWVTTGTPKCPTGFDPDGAGGTLFSVASITASGAWGSNTFNATYSLDLTGDKMKYFPAGDYVITVTHTATTN